ISQNLVRLPAAPEEAGGYGSSQAARGGDRLREVLDRRQRRVHAQGLLAGSARILQRPGPVAGLEEVVGQIAPGPVPPRLAKPYHRFADRLVQIASFAREEIEVHRLAGQRVPKGESLGRLLDDEIPTNQLLD